MPSLEGIVTKNSMENLTCILSVISNKLTLLKTRRYLMKLNDIRKIAKNMGLKAGKVKKADLIKKIQESEGNFTCFQTAGDFCDQEACCWRSDCLVH